MKESLAQYQSRFEAMQGRTLFPRFREQDRGFLRALSCTLRLTFQELKTVCEAGIDLSQWGETPLADWWEKEEARVPPAEGRAHKKEMLRRMEEHLSALRSGEKTYPRHAPRLEAPPRPEPVFAPRPDRIAGPCPVASDRTLCCRLRTIDAALNCSYACSYCIIQSFYDRNRVIFDTRFREKLAALEIDPGRLYHFGSGQSSDSLLWGNTAGVLDALLDFAASHPNVLLELKTKSTAVGPLCARPVPPNVVCSWSLNTPTLVRNEEHGTPPLGHRLRAALKLCGHGVPVAFHFHPMMTYRGWQDDYAAVARRLIRLFDPARVLFVSFGSLTFIRPVVQKIRERGQPTRVLQMEFARDPHGKLTYPDATKVRLFRTLYEAFSPWHGKVYFYLCMEKREIWRKTFGFDHADSAAFERDFLQAAFARLGPNARRR